MPDSKLPALLKSALFLANMLAAAPEGVSRQEQEVGMLWMDARVAKWRTSFQPVSSWASSAVSSWLYLEMSRCSVRIMIMATMPLRNSTIMSELMMLNQWIWSSVISRYVSHRDAHRMSLCCMAMH